MVLECDEGSAIFDVKALQGLGELDASVVL